MRDDELIAKAKQIEIAAREIQEFLPEKGDSCLVGGDARDRHRPDYENVNLWAMFLAESLHDLPE